LRSKLIAAENDMPFGMGFGDVILILVIVVVVFGSTKLPNLGDGLGRLLRGEQASPPRLLMERQRKSWTRSDWALVIAAVVVGAAALALLLRRH
jgi:TatA/E family protein of Tat protein translocase